MPTVEELLRFPRKGDAVIPSPTPLDRYRGDPADAYAFGYRMAANILAEHVRGQGCEAVLFYPVVFLYRHHVELMLKNLIFRLDSRDRGQRIDPADARARLQRKSEARRKSGG